jgi:hypothetical protein
MLARKTIVGREGQYEEGSSLIVTKPVHPWPSLSQAQPVHVTLKLTATVGSRPSASVPDVSRSGLAWLLRHVRISRN